MAQASAPAHGRSNLPATRSRGGPVASRDTLSATPFDLMRRLSDDMDQLFGQLVGGLARSGPVTQGSQLDWMPAIETEQHDDRLVVRADLPGMSVNDIAVEFDGGILTIAGERRDKREVGGEHGARRTEVRYGRFARGIGLPEGTESDNIQAAFQDGVLEITIPTQQQARTHRRRIQVQDGASSSGAQNGGHSAVGASADNAERP